MNELIDEAYVWAQRTKWVRRCRYCKQPMGEPLKYGERIYSFCCLEHKKDFDLGRKTIEHLEKGHVL